MSAKHKVLTPRKFYWILRISAVSCFIGHGAYGLLKKPDWLPYLAVVNIGPDWANYLFPLIGLMDISLALSVLFYPVRTALLWMACWGVWTALLRPLAGQGVWEFFERAGNYGVPFAYFMLSKWQEPSIGWVTKIKEHALTQPAIDRLIFILKISTGLLLIGHGGFGAFQQKEMLIRHFASVGMSIDAGALTIIGWFEIILGLTVMLKPFRLLLSFIFFWKIATELLYPLSGTLIWEFIERFGSYCAPLAVLFLVQLKKDAGSNSIPSGSKRGY